MSNGNKKERSEAANLLRMCGIAVCFMLALPFIVKSGAMGLVFVVFIIYLFKVQERRVRKNNPPSSNPRHIIIQRIKNNEYAVYDGETLGRINERNFYSVSQAQLEMAIKFPGIAVKVYE